MRLVYLTASIGKLAYFYLVRITLGWSDVDTERRIRNMLVVEFNADAVLAFKQLTKKKQIVAITKSVTQIALYFGNELNSSEAALFLVFGKFFHDFQFYIDQDLSSALLD